MDKKRIKIVMQKMEEYKVIAGALAVVLAIAFAFGLYAFRGAIFISSNAQSETEDLNSVSIELEIRHPLTGHLTEDFVDPPQVFAVMIDGHYNAHSHSGIDNAFLVIEAPVEANIPRSVAFFYEGQDDVEQIGSVRSARPYYIDWANELDAMYVHVGGSPEALQIIAATDTFDFNQYWHGNNFWRSSRKAAPHNLFTSLELLEEGLEDEREKERAPEKLVYGIWKFKDHEPDRSDEEVGVTIKYASPVYEVEWKFDDEKNRYLRYFNRRVDKTTEGDEIWADNVAIVVTEIEVIDGEGRRRLQTIGEGEATVLQDGIKIEAKWKKNSVSERLRFFDREGDEIEMNSGKTWIQVIGSEKLIEFEE